MNKYIFFVFYLSTSIISGSEISISISENLVNDYLKIIGDHEIPKGPKGDQATWSIKTLMLILNMGLLNF